MTNLDKLIAEAERDCEWHWSESPNCKDVTDRIRRLVVVVRRQREYIKSEAICICDQAHQYECESCEFEKEIQRISAGEGKE